MPFMPCLPKTLRFGKGYLAEHEIQEDYKGLSRLIRETKKHFADLGGGKASDISTITSICLRAGLKSRA